jgi:peptidoglycan/LPS O-acetylase OafA/YrhL
MDAYIDFANGWTNWSLTDNVLFIGFSRFFWGVGLSLILLPMLLGYIPLATWFLSLSIWVPFARLTFCTYLIHLHLIFIYYLSQNTAYWFDDLNLVVDFVFITIISFGAAVPLTLLVESPFMAFEKLMKSRNAKDRVK